MGYGWTECTGGKEKKRSTKKKNNFESVIETENELRKQTLFGIFWRSYLQSVCCSFLLGWYIGWIFLDAAQHGMVLFMPFKLNSHKIMLLGVRLKLSEILREI